jgi:hypothetical protein
MELNTDNARAFNNSLKQSIKEKFGIKVKVEIINSYNFPKCNVRIYPDKKDGEFLFSNDLKLKVFDACGHDRKGLLNADAVSYGTIQSNWISCRVQEWQKLFDSM